MDSASNRTVPYVLVRRERVEEDVERLGAAGNNGRKVCATRVLRELGERELDDPEWNAPAVLPTGPGGLEISTLTEFTAQDRHKHERSTEVYTVLRGELSVWIDDRGPLRLAAGDELVVLPGTVHELVRAKRRAREPEEPFDLLVRVHAFPCHGATDKLVQLVPGGEWLRWDGLSETEKRSAWRKQG